MDISFGFQQKLFKNSNINPSEGLFTFSNQGRGGNAMGASKVGWGEVGDILEFEKRSQEKLVEQLKEIKRSYRFGDVVIEKQKRETTW